MRRSRASRRAKRADVERELRSSIEDGIEERVGAGEDRTAAERAVLEGLGDPSVLASGYTGKPNYLIGPELFPVWRSVVPKILGTAVPIVAFITASVSLADDGTIADSLAAGLSAAIGVGVQIAFWSTLFFVFLERADAARQARDEVTAKLAGWTVERLPEGPRKGISISETVGEVVTVGFTAIGLLVAETLSVAGPSGPIPIVEPSLGSFWIPFLFATLLALGVIHVFVYTVGRWTMGFAALYAIVEVAWAAPIVWLALKGIPHQPGLRRAHRLPSARLRRQPGDARDRDLRVDLHGLGDLRRLPQGPPRAPRRRAQRGSGDVAALERTAALSAYPGGRAGEAKVRYGVLTERRVMRARARLRLKAFTPVSRSLRERPLATDDDRGVRVSPTLDSRLIVVPNGGWILVIAKRDHACAQS